MRDRAPLGRGMFGFLTAGMEEAVSACVRGQEVWDLGAGPALPFSGRLVTLGAARVVAVDKLEEVLLWPQHEQIEVRHALFEQVAPPSSGIDVAFLSWPSPHSMSGLVPLLETAKTVVYLGKNDAFRACGSRAMFRHLRRRPVLGEHQHDVNDLVVYGPPPGAERAPLREEVWGLDNP